jgi:hypothetical protein
LAIKWIATKLATMGLLPKVLQDALQLNGVAKGEEKAPLTTLPKGGPSKVQVLESQEAFQKLVGDDSQTVVCKFTAT